jgi:chorismate synthase
LSAGNSFGRLFRVTTFGESHGPAVGCVIDGCPALLPLSRDVIQRELDRRKPGGGGASTTRNETDQCEILSGVFEGQTLGTPIAIIIRNTAHNSADYDHLKDIFRPGHADWCWEAKFGIRDHRGGGRSSARETAGRVAAGAVAKALLARSGISVQAWVSEIGGISAPHPSESSFDFEEAERNSLRVPCAAAAQEIAALIEQLRAEQDSIGGVVNCRVLNLVPGLGEPVFDKLDALLAQALLSVGAAKGIEFGSGFDAARSRGSENNDRPCTQDNNAGGMAGGISTGNTLEFRVAFKAVPSIAREQETRDRSGAIRSLHVQGRHDVCVCPRAVPVVEAMTALVLADLMLQNRSARIAP